MVAMGRKSFLCGFFQESPAYNHLDNIYSLYYCSYRIHGSQYLSFSNQM